MKTITIHKVVELNKKLEEQALPYKIHLRDACGAQSFTIEAIGENWVEEKQEQMQELLGRFFEENGVTILWSVDQRGFMLE